MSRSMLPLAQREIKIDENGSKNINIRVPDAYFYFYTHLNVPYIVHNIEFNFVINLCETKMQIRSAAT